MLGGQEALEKPPRWSKENFLEEDSDANLIIENGVIKAASFPKLVSKLTMDADPSLLKEFLLTHRSFTQDGLELLNALKTRFESVNEAVDNEDEAAVIKFKTLNVLKNWLEHFCYDFLLDCPDLSVATAEWMDTLQNETGPISKTAATIKAKLELSLHTREKPRTKVAPHDPPKSYMPKDPDAPILDCHPEEIARQMTLVEWKLWCSIHPFEFLNLSWTKSDKEHRAPNIIMCINHFNYVSSWVTTSICACEKVKDRVKVIAKWIDVAQRLQAMGNLNGMMEVLSGLSKGPVHRLKATFAQLKAKESKFFSIFEDMNANTRPNNAYALLRKMLLSKNPPVIPYLGMYLTDLTFIEEGNRDYVGENLLINFYKRRLLTNTLTDIQNYQHHGYNFVEIPSMAWAIMYGSENKTEEELYDISLILEPRASKSELPQKPTRSGSLSFIPSPKKFLSSMGNSSESESPTTPKKAASCKAIDSPSKSSPSLELTASSPTPELRRSKSASIRDKFITTDDGAGRLRISRTRTSETNSSPPTTTTTEVTVSWA